MGGIFPHPMKMGRRKEKMGWGLFIWGGDAPFLQIFKGQKN